MTTNALSYRSITLPSKGALYGERIPGGRVDVRKMTAQEEALMAAQSGSPIEKINRLLDACSKLPNGFPLADLLSTDKFYLLLAIRTHTFGSKYTVPYKCQFCGAQHQEKVDISEDFQPKKIKGEVAEPISVKLVDANCEVQVRFLRGSDEERVAKYAKRMKLSKSNDPSDPSYLFRLGIQIRSKDGVEFEDPIAKEEFVSKLTAADTRRISLAVDDAEPGLDTTVYAECASCGALNEFDMPFTAEFFRPSQL